MDLATSWSWNEDGTELSFQLRESVRWHDGRPFTAKDVLDLFDLADNKAQPRHVALQLGQAFGGSGMPSGVCTVARGSAAPSVFVFEGAPAELSANSEVRREWLEV